MFLEILQRKKNRWIVRKICGLLQIFLPIFRIAATDASTNIAAHARLLHVNINSTYKYIM